MARHCNISRIIIQYGIAIQCLGQGLSECWSNIGHYNVSHVGPYDKTNVGPMAAYQCLPSNHEATFEN